MKYPLISDGNENHRTVRLSLPKPPIIFCTAILEYKIEICVGSATAAFEAQQCGADRVELCSALSEGGLTPSLGEMKTARKLLSSTMLHTIIRPRKGDFLYSDTERQSMLADIISAREIGVDGVVIGCLTAEGEIDTALTGELIAAAGNMSITFHRAFDMCRNPQEALEQLIGLGCHRILTSGAQRTAEKGISVLRSLVRQAGNRTVIMPGCGISSRNIKEIALGTGASEFHFSANRTVNSHMAYRNPAVSMGSDETTGEYELTATDTEKINSIRHILDTLKP